LDGSYNWDVSNEQRRTWLAFGLALALPIAASALLLFFRDRIDNGNIALTLVVPVVAVSLMRRRVSTLVAALSAALWFDFFYTRPYHSFAIRSSDDVVTAVILLVVGVAVGELAIWGQHHRTVAIEHGGDIARIHSIAELVAEGEPAEFVVMAVARELRELLGVRDVRFESAPLVPDAKPIAVIEQTGAVRIGQIAWGADSMGLPGPTEIAVQSGGRVWGRFVLEPTPGLGVPFERRIVAVALADQVGAALATSNSVAG
jgi:hypothetical protein